MTDTDLIRASAQAGRVVVYEEAARDGAQAKTLMSAEARVELARSQGAMFGADGPRHVVYAAGFPAVCHQEAEAIRRVADEAQDAVSVSAVCRVLPEDVALGLKALRGKRNTRLLVIVPSSEDMCQISGYSAPEVLAHGIATVRQAVQDAAGEVAVDVIMGDAPHADPGRLADASAAMTEHGAGVIVLADTIGSLLPHETSALFDDIARRAGDRVVLGAHLHNDLGLALANNLAAMRSGARVIATSWLGFAERSGMCATEQLVFLLAHDPKRAPGLVGADVPLWWAEPDLKALPPIAELVSRETGVPLTVTTPIVGSGVGTTCAGTHFLNARKFQAFDPHELLGIEQQTILTQLVSGRIVQAVAEEFGRVLGPDDTRTAMRWIKDRAFQRNEAVVSREDFAVFLDGLAAGRLAAALAD